MDGPEQAAPHVVGQFRYLAQQFGRGGGNQGRDECGGAVPAVQFNGSGRDVGRSGGEVRPSPAVHMGVDETGHHRHCTEVTIRGPRRSFPVPTAFTVRFETSIQPGP